MEGLLQDLKEGQKERRAKKAAVKFIEREYLGRTSWRERARLAWTRFKFLDVAYFCGAARLVYEYIGLVGTECSGVLTLVVFNGYSFSEAKSFIQRERSFAETPRYNYFRREGKQ